MFQVCVVKTHTNRFWKYLCVCVDRAQDLVNNNLNRTIIQPWNIVMDFFWNLKTPGYIEESSSDILQNFSIGILWKTKHHTGLE